MLTVSPKTVVNFYNGTDKSVPYEMVFAAHRRASIYACRGNLDRLFAVEDLNRYAAKLSLFS